MILWAFDTKSLWTVCKRGLILSLHFLKAKVTLKCQLCVGHWEMFYKNIMISSGEFGFVEARLITFLLFFLGLSQVYTKILCYFMTQQLFNFLRDGYFKPCSAIWQKWRKIPLLCKKGSEISNNKLWLDVSQRRGNSVRVCSINLLYQTHKDISSQPLMILIPISHNVLSYH